MLDGRKEKMPLRLAVFTNQFPGRVSTFFARDIVSLLKEGFSVDIFPVYPIQETYWKFVPVELRKVIWNNSRTIFVSPVHAYWRSRLGENFRQVLRDSLRFGVRQFLKSLYVIRQAVSWSRLFEGQYDYMLSYWGNYAGTYAFLANLGLKNPPPYAFFLHAGTDLYRDQIILDTKLQYAITIFTVCEFNKKFLQQLYPDIYPLIQNKLFLHHLGVDLTDLQVNLDQREPFTVLAVGSLIPQKGFNVLLEAVSLLVEDFPELRLIIIGNGPERKNLWKRSNQLGISEKVIWKGHLPFEEVKKFFSQSTLLVHPSVGLGDAVPTVIKEAMATGLPVIASEIVGIPELLDYGKCGVLVPSGDVEALAKAIKDLLLDQGRRRQLAEAARRYVEQTFNMQKNGKRLAEKIRADILFEASQNEG